MRVLRGFWRLLVGIKDMLVLLLLLLFFGLLYAALSAAPNPAIPSSGALLLTLDGAIVEQPRETQPFELLSGGATEAGEYRLRDVIQAIDAAAGDTRIKAVALDLDGFAGGGQAALGDVGAALDRVRRAGKPVLTFATGYTDEGYQLAAHASEIWLDPLGAVLIAGPGGSNLYFKGFLDKIGVTPKVYRVGEFKSAVEPFTRADQSPEARAANQALVDALWASWREEVGKARPKARIADYAARPAVALSAAGGDPAEAARAAGLVDQIGDRTAFGRRMADLAGPAKSSEDPNGFAGIPLDNWVAANPVSTSGSPIGVLTVAGDIVDGDAIPGTAGGDGIARLLLTELRKGRIKALVVRVDSPGGSVTGSERIRTAILEAKRQKLPVVISMGSVAASGGYWIATAGDRIYAEPSTITGSIGVFGIIPTFQGTMEKLGLSVDGVKTTPLTGEPDVFAGTSPEFDALIQTGIEHVYARFTGLVAKARKLTPERVDEIGQGRVWAGGVARQIGLVDAFGSTGEAIAEAARLAKLDPAKVYPLHIEQPASIASQFLAMFKPGQKEEGARDAYSRIASRPDRMMRTALASARRVASGPAIQVRCLECPAIDAPVSTAIADPTLLTLILRSFAR